MADIGETGTQGSQGVVATQSKSIPLFERGVYTSGDFARAFSALMSDTVSGRLAPGIVNAVCNAGGKMLKVVEMEMKYGTSGAGQDRKILALADRPVS